MTLLFPRKPPTHDLIDLRCASAAELAGEAGDLVIADPPWLYERAVGEGVAADHYGGLPVAEIVAHIDALTAPRLALWHTWPILTGDWPERVGHWGRPTTGGSWLKSDPNDSGHFGQGYHWAGCSEPVLIYTTGGGYTDRTVPVRNAWHERPGLHSRKPVEWMAQWIRKWVPPGGRVIDPYAGLGAVAEAVLVAGEDRTYLGTEIDPERHLSALALLAQWRG